MSNNMSFTLWDVEHGLAVWIQTPYGHNHWIDAGRNTGADFSPAWHARNVYHEESLDYLVISHPDADHINDLPDLVKNLGEPRVLCRNKTLPDAEKYGSGVLEYQRVFRDLDSRYNSTIPEDRSPCNPVFNGGVQVVTRMLTFDEANQNSNDASVVAFYLYAKWLFICPGDIEPSGWSRLWEKYSEQFAPLLNAGPVRVLVAPHHGRPSGYSEAMMDTVEPNLVLISDEHGQADTDPRYRISPSGLTFGNTTYRFISTKTSGRVRLEIADTGEARLDVQ